MNEQSIGSYETLGELGRGAMGVVYRARHRETGALVALKTLQAQRPALSEAMQREIYALSRLSHPGIVSILDFGVSEGQPWYAMPLLEGQTLRARCGAPWPEAELVPLLGSLCEALAFLHGSGVVHRDLKPENIIIADGAAPILVDFGLSVTQRELSREAIDDSSEISGTVEYMSPEQIMGEVVDARSDLYSLGCITYELLTGRPPFQEKLAAKTLRAHLQTPPRPPSEQHEGIPPKLEQLTLRLLEKSPRARLGHASSVLHALGFEAREARPYLYRAGLVGREEALSTLSCSLLALEEARGSFFLLEGVSGVGKTRLLLELSRLAVRRQARVITGQCLPRSDIEAPLSPLQRLLRGFAEAREVLGEEASVLAPYEAALAPFAAQRAPELPPEAARLRLFSALSRALSRFAARQALVLLLDDLQWADELTLGFLAHWRTQQAPVLLVASYRSEEGQALEGLRKDTPRISLKRLGEEAVSAMVGDMLAASQPEAFTRFLLRSSEGNPFFVAEYLRAILQQGLLAQDQSGHWIVEGRAEGYEALPLPKTLRELVERRLSGLRPRAVAMIQAAAIVGRPGPQALLAGLAGLATKEAMAATQELLSQQVLEEAEEGLRFTHDKLREVAYEAITGAQATTLHRAAALELERLSAQPAELGYHFERGAMATEARRYYLSAARDAVRSNVLQEAERLYLAYLRLIEDQTAESLAARNELAKSVLYDTGRYQEAITQSLITQETARALGEPRAESQGLFVQGVSLAGVGKIEDANTRLEEALERQRAQGDERAEGLTLHALGVIKRMQGQLEDAYALCTQALTLHRKVKNRVDEGISMGILAGIEWQRGELESAARSFAEALALHRENKNRLSEGIIIGNLAGVLWQQKELAQAAARYRQALQIHREVGNLRSAGTTLYNLAVVEQDRGLLEEARVLLEESIAMLQALHAKFYLGHSLLFRAALQRRSGGPLDGVEADLSEAESIFQEMKSQGPLLRCYCERGHLALSQNQSATEHIQKARALEPKPKSEEERAVIALEKAAESDHLFRGERPEDLPEGLRKRLLG